MENRTEQAFIEACNRKKQELDREYLVSDFGSKRTKKRCINLKVKMDTKEVDKAIKKTKKLIKLLKKTNRMEEKISGKNVLKNIYTCDLVEELKGREGVAVEQAEPYNIKNIEVNGPAVVLIITD